MLVGCVGPTRQSWVQHQGGLLTGPRQQRVDRIARQVVPADLRDAVTVRVLNSDTVSAYAWPDGRIYVTRGLVDLCDDAEVAAAIAHELGHLLGDGHLEAGPAAGLRGCAEDLDAEAHADLIGAELLGDRGLPSSAMASMLSKVRDADRVGSSCREALTERILLLESRSGAVAAGTLWVRR